MCGIFGYIGNSNKAAKIVLNGLKSLEYRGYDSWGVAIVPIEIPNFKFQISKLNNKIIVKKRVGKIGDANVDELPPSSLAIGHTRWATHGGVFEKNAHPHLDCTKKIAVVHNGIIENYDQIKKELIAKKHSFISQTDTEVAVHLIEEYCKKTDFVSSTRIAFNRFSGLSAFLVINTTENKIIAIRSGSPLVVGFAKNENFIASDSAALLPHTKTVYFMEDNDMVVIYKDHVEVYDAPSGKSKQIVKSLLKWEAETSEKGKYQYFMLKEIFEQPEIINKVSKKGVAQAENLANSIKKSFGTYMVGCGTAGYACLAGSYLFSKIAKRHINWAIGSEFSYHLDFLTPKSLVIALSQSGETMDIIESIKAAKEKKAKIASLVNVAGSTLYRLSDIQLEILAGVEKGVASTKAFTAKLSHLILVAYSLINQIKKAQFILQKASNAVALLLTERSVTHIKNLAIKLKNSPDIYVIGRGLSYPASLETALKIKEISYIHSEGLAAGELKHGPLALVKKGTPCIAFLPNDETYGANLAGAMEMKARGGYIIGASFKPHEVFDYFINVPDCQEATIIPNVVFAQLLAYYLATSKGLDPDKPRNLAKSVTVK